MGDPILLLGHAKQTGLIYQAQLRQLGYATLASTWLAFSQVRKKPSLIIADMDRSASIPMQQLLTQVRKRWGMLVPVLAVTSSTRFSTLSSLLECGAAACLPREIALDPLARKIAKCRHIDKDGEKSVLTDIPNSLVTLFSGRGLIALADAARVHSGAMPKRSVFRRMAPPDENWRGVVGADSLDRFCVGKPSSYLRWNRFSLFRVPETAEFDVPEKVLLRRAGPPLVAAVDRSRLPAGTDVYSIVPGECASAGYLACVLNSRLMDFYFNRLAGAGIGGRLGVNDIRQAPIPAPSSSHLRDFDRLANLLAHYGPRPSQWIDRRSREEVAEEMENLVFDLYGASSDAIGCLQAMHF